MLSNAPLCLEQKSFWGGCVSSPASRCSSQTSTSGSLQTLCSLQSPACRTVCLARRSRLARREHRSCVLHASESEGEFEPNKEFGYSRKDILLIGGGLFGLGLAAYYGLQAVGVEPGMAGNFVQFGIFVFFVVGWIASYILRVVNKDMTYTKQLDAYENAVMKKRLEEMPESERDRLYAEIESEREAKKQRQQQ